MDILICHQKIGTGQRVEVNMHKKLIIIISASIIIVIIVIISALYFINQSNTKKPVVTDTSDNNSEYTVESGLEAMAKIVKPAVESYVTQDITESKTARNARLNAYFSPDSPVFNRDIEIRSTNSATKTTASVTSINSSTAEGQYPMLIVKTDITNYSGDSNNTSSQKYWIIIKKNINGSYIADDIGIWML